MPSTKNKLRVGRYKRGRPPKPKSEETEPAIRRDRGRPKSAHLFPSDAQKYLVLAWQIIGDQQTTNSRGKDVLSDATYVRRYMRKSYVEAVKRNRGITILVKEIESKINAAKDSVEKGQLTKMREYLLGKRDKVQEVGDSFRPSGPGGRWTDGDFKNHVEYERTYRHVLRHLKVIRTSLGSGASHSESPKTSKK
jgi:hypothetical protein